MELIIEPVWSWLAVASAATGLIALVVMSYRRQGRTLSKSQRRLLLVLKLAAVAIIVFTLIRPALQFSETDENSVQLLVALDVSRSMNVKDAPGGQTRLQAALQDLERSSSRWAALNKKVVVRRFEFDAEARPSREKITEGDGDQTAIGYLLEEMLREVRQQRTIGLMLLTDGAQRAVPPHDQDPLTTARKLAFEQAPIYPFGYGATSLSTSTVDLAVRDMLVDPVVFEKKLVPIKVQLKGVGLAGRKVKVRVLVEDRGSLATGQSGELKPAPAAQLAVVQKDVELKGSDVSTALDLSFVPQRPGEVKIAVEAIPVDGEVLTRNNRTETIITVRQGGIRVAYFDVVRIEQKALRMVNGADKIQLDFFDVRGGRFRQKTILDPALFERGAYDVYLIGDVPADIFGKDLLTALAARVTEGCGLMMLGGLQNLDSGGYGNGPLADLLPITLSPSRSRGPDNLDLRGQLTGPQIVVPTDTGLKRYVMQLASSDKNRARWESLAPLVGATRLTPKSALVEVWAQTRDGTPLLCASEVGRARVAAFGGDTTYQWVMHGQATEHQRFWRQMILWLSRKEADSNQAVWVKVEPRNFIPGAKVPLEVGARNEAGQPIEDAAFTVEVTDPSGAKQPVGVAKSPAGAIAEFLNSATPGDYWVRVDAKRGGAPLGLPATTRFIVDPRDLELDQPNADYELLGKLAELTGGQLFRGEELENFLTRLEDLKLDDLTRVQIIPLWDNVWVLLIFVGLLTAEWALRKKWGLA